MSNQSKRYQECSWYEKLWRRRFYLTIPSKSIQIWWLNKNDPELPMSFVESWGLAIGLAQSQMNWYYTSEETWRSIDKMISDMETK